MTETISKQQFETHLRRTLRIRQNYMKRAWGNDKERRALDSLERIEGYKERYEFNELKMEIAYYSCGDNLYYKVMGEKLI